MDHKDDKGTSFFPGLLNCELCTDGRSELRRRQAFPTEIFKIISKRFDRHTNNRIDLRTVAVAEVNLGF